MLCLLLAWRGGVWGGVCVCVCVCVGGGGGGGGDAQFHAVGSIRYGKGGRPQQATKIWINTDSGNGLLPDHTKPLT